MILLAHQIRYWKQVLLIVQPDTVLRWHRKSQTKPGRQQIDASTVELIKQMGRENRLWGLNGYAVSY